MARDILIAYRSDFAIDHITQSFLRKYQLWMERAGCSVTTIGIYLRNIGHIFNQAIKLDERYRSIYPFGPDKYLIPVGNNAKRALEITEIKRIFKYAPEGRIEERSLAFWKLTFLANGLNMKDLALLRFSDIAGEHIMMKCRAKIRRTLKRNIPPIIIYLSPEVNKIIKDWGNTMNNEDDYIFPILLPGLTEEEIDAKVHGFIKLVNKGMKSITGKLDLSLQVTTMVARHSFASVAEWSGKTVKFIMEQLGQTSMNATMNYLKSILTETKKQHAIDVLSLINNEAKASPLSRHRINKKRPKVRI